MGSEMCIRDRFQTLQRQIDGNSAQAQFLETQKQLNDVKERFEAKDKSIELLQKELSELRRAKENEAQAAQRAEKLALEQSVKQRDAEIEQLRKQLSEDDLSTPRDRGALFALRRQLARASRRDARRLRRDLDDLRRVRAADARAAQSALNEIARSLSGAPAPARPTDFERSRSKLVELPARPPPLLFANHPDPFLTSSHLF